MPTSIQWTDETWNPLTGCTRVSDGCTRCYAERLAAGRLRHTPKYEGLTENGRWNGKIRFHPEVLEQPLRWKKPRRIFVCSMSDLFHESLDRAEGASQIAAIFGVMAYAKDHVFQVLTKRPHLMARWLEWVSNNPLRSGECGQDVFECSPVEVCMLCASRLSTSPLNSPMFGIHMLSDMKPTKPMAWPLPNVWLGTSVENQAAADERIPQLLQCPAAVRFVSYEPALSSVHFGPYFRWGICEGGTPTDPCCTSVPLGSGDEWGVIRCPACGSVAIDEMESSPGLDLVICGGESGPGARPADVSWFRDVRDQCQEAGVSFFMKQMGRCPTGLLLDDPKGGDMAEWPEDLRIREMPAANEFSASKRKR